MVDTHGARSSASDEFLTDGDLRRRLRVVLESVLDNEVEVFYWTEFQVYVEELFDLGRRLAMAAGRKQEPEPATLREIDQLEQYIESVEEDRRLQHEMNTAQNRTHNE